MMGLFIFAVVLSLGAIKLLVWLRGRLPNHGVRASTRWRGFYRESLAYYAGTPRWRFYGYLPMAWTRFWWLSRKDKKVTA